MCDNRGLFRSEASLGKVGGEHNTAEGSRDEITSTVVYATGWFHRPAHCVRVAGWFHRTCPLCLCSRMVPQSPSTVCMQPDGYTEPIYCVCVAEWLHRAHPLCLWGRMVTQSQSTVSMLLDGYTEPNCCCPGCVQLGRQCNKVGLTFHRLPVCLEAFTGPQQCDQQRKELSSPEDKDLWTSRA